MFFLIGTAPALQVPRIAILPFNPVGVSESDAQILTNLFEAAVVNTGVFDVIEQNQADQILDAQAYTLSSCTDEACAVEIGELLAAENIIIGSVSKLGGMFIVTAKIIDVTTGKNIRADSVQGQQIEDMTVQVGVLADKLAGISFRGAGLTANQAAAGTAGKGTGEIFIHTDPGGAEVFINGMTRGQSPLLLKSVPAGLLLVEARKGPLYASSEVNIKLDELIEITLALEATPGRLFIQTDNPLLNVIIDGKDAGKASSGLFKDIVPGQHELVLENADQYYKGTFSVEPGKTTEVEVYPAWLGAISWHLPEAATASLTGEMRTAVYTGEGEDRLPSGSYRVKISGPYYNDFETEIRIKKDSPCLLTPELSFSNSPEAKKYLTKKRIETLAAEREELQRQVRRLQPKSWIRTTGWVIAGTSAVELLIAGTAAVAGLVAITSYNNSTDAITISTSRNTAETCSNIMNYSLWPGLALGAVSPFLITAKVNDDPESAAERGRLADRIEAIDTETAELKEAVK